MAVSLRAKIRVWIRILVIIKWCKQKFLRPIFRLIQKKENLRSISLMNLGLRITTSMPWESVVTISMALYQKAEPNVTAYIGHGIQKRASGIKIYEKSSRSNWSNTAALLVRLRKICRTFRWSLARCRQKWRLCIVKCNMISLSTKTSYSTSHLIRRRRIIWMHGWFHLATGWPTFAPSFSSKATYRN